MITIAMLEAKKSATQIAQNLTKRFTMVVNQCAKAVRILSKGSEEHMLGLCLDRVEQRWGKYMIMLIHQATLVIVVNVDVAIGILIYILIICVLAMGVIR